jgi:hypothetical protein
MAVHIDDATLDRFGEEFDRMRRDADALRATLAGSTKQARQQLRPLGVKARENLRRLRELDISITRLADAIEGVH